MIKYKGLSIQQVKKLREQFGPNEIKDVAKVTPFKIFIRQIKQNFIIYLLFVAMALSFFVDKDITAYTILGVILVVIFSGFIQEYKAEKSIESLKNMIMPVSLVIREGKEMEAYSEDLVPGDVLILGSGERIPADCVILEERELRLDEAVLTGESKEIRKTSVKNKNPEENKLFMGTFIINGRCVARIEHTGMNTRFGKIAAMISTSEKEMPLQKKVNRISKYMVAVAVIISFLTALILIISADTLSRDLLVDVLILAVALSVSAFPEGFPVVLTTTLATGVARMAKNNAIVNRMSIIETLGETTVICSDKTGTITKGEMTVNKIYANNKEYEITGSGYIGTGEFLYNKNKINPLEDIVLNLNLKTAVLCNDSRIQRTGEDSELRVIGTPTEGALLVMAAKAGLFSENLEIERLYEIPFSSERKMMSTLIKEGEDYYILAKGAPEVLLSKCTKILEKGKTKTLSKEKRQEILDINRKMNSETLRTLMFAYKPANPSDVKYKEEDFIYLGLVGMEDPPREEIQEALSDCRSAGVKVKMITGDNKETALAISQQIGLEGKLLEGWQLDELSDEELVSIAKETTIFARVRPEHKLRIVKALKKSDEIVTMTGDGVNDAPALKEAHIGVAMGKNGTDATRSVSDLVLKDDNFSTIVLAIKEGRTIFTNIRKFVSYQLSCNVAELYIIFLGVILAPFFGWNTPLLLALHILFMNLVTDNLPAITLGLNPYSKDVMEDPPRKDTHILNKPLAGVMAVNGFLMGTIILIVYYVSFNVFHQSVESARTTALFCLIILEIASAFNFRSFRKLSLTRSPFVNPYLVYASVISLFATLAIIYTKAGQKIFDTVSLGVVQWATAILTGLLILLIFDVLKVYSKRKNIFLAKIT